MFNGRHRKVTDLMYAIIYFKHLFISDISDALQTIDATDLNDEFKGFQLDEKAVDKDDSAAMMRTQRPFFFQKIGPPQQDDFFHNSVLAGVFPDSPFPTTPPPFFETPFVPESAVSPPLESSAAEAEQLLPLEPTAPDGLMTSEELALLNKILVTDDMTPEGKVDIFEFWTFFEF